MLPFCVSRCFAGHDCCDAKVSLTSIDASTILNQARESPLFNLLHGAEMRIKAILTCFLTIGFLTAMVSAGQANLIVNGDFESPALSTNPNFGPTAFMPASNYVYPGFSAPLTFASWTYNGGAGLIDTSQGSNAWYGNTSPSGFSGNQYAFVQNSGILSQQFSSAVSGPTTISWLEGSRPDFGCCNGNQTYQVLLNGNVIYSNTTPSGQNFTLESAIGSLVAGPNTLKFLGLSKNPDSTVFLDDVTVAAVPEASTWIMMLLGFLGVGLASYRRMGRLAFRLA